MSGPFGSSQWMYSSGGFYPYEIKQSLRLNDDDSAYLSRTPASAGNRKTWTWSGWVKRGNITPCVLFGVSNGSTNQFYIQFAGSNSLGVDDWNGSIQLRKVSTAVFRDPSAWYHIVVSLDTTQATAADRAKLYVNGERITSFSSSTDPSLNYDGAVNSTTLHALGREEFADTAYFDGYMAEVNFIDGLALDPTSFGEFKSDIWVPKAYSGSYGTNGFYLPFSDGAAIGDDLSGNGNDWTPSGLASTDVMLDSPTNNYAVLNQLSAGAAAKAVLADGNLFFGITASAGRDCWATITPPSGKWYWEVTAGSVGATPSLSVAVSLQPTDAKRARYASDGTVSQSGLSGTSGTGSFASYTTADVIGVALDVDAKSVAFYKNNVLQTTVTWTDDDDLTPYVSGNNFASTSNFGQSPFAYTPPSGFLALNTANLPAPAIDPAEDDVPADYFNTVLYTGDGTSSHAITDVGFQPDFTWIKERNQAGWHRLSDAIRGPNALLFSNDTSAEDTTAGNFLSFDTDGFTVGSDGSINGNTDTYVAWNWLAGNGTASNTDGTITSTVSVNQKAGFSIVSYTGTGANATVGHGLGAAPKMVIVKNRDSAVNWVVYHPSVGNTTALSLNLTSAPFSPSALYWNNTSPSSSVFSIGAGSTVNTNTEDYIAYCFAEVEGFSKFGSYTGNGSADGSFVYCGFRPAFVMMKRANSTGNWVMKSATIDPHNLADKALYANLSQAESSGVSGRPVDLLSNGFKARSTEVDINANGGTFIFAAFAEQPFKYSNAR